MKTISLTTLAALAAVLLFANPRAQAQAEVDPDHYDVMEPDSVSQKTHMDTQGAKVHYQGKVTLPHRIQCEGKSLHPGAYLVSLDSEGKTVLFTPNRKDGAVRITGVARRQAHYRGQDALVLERSGNERQLAAIHLGDTDLVFTRSEENPASGADRTIEKLFVLSGASK
jgi:hypothetical protein